MDYNNDSGNISAYDNQCINSDYLDGKGRAMKSKIEINREAIADFCRRNHIRELSLFGSVLRSDFRPDSDVDVLVEFEQGRVPGFIRLAKMERELSEILGRKADMRTAEELSRYFRDDVIAEAEVQYAA